MYIKLDNKLYEKIIEKIGYKNGEIIEKNDYIYVELKDILSMLDDLVSYIDELKLKEEERYNELLNEIEEKYELKKVDYNSFYGVNERDF